MWVNDVCGSALGREGLQYHFLPSNLKTVSIIPFYHLFSASALFSFDLALWSLKTISILWRKKVWNSTFTRWYTSWAILCWGWPKDKKTIWSLLSYSSKDYKEVLKIIKGSWVARGHAQYVVSWGLLGVILETVGGAWTFLALQDLCCFISWVLVLSWQLGSLTVAGELQNWKKT